VAPVKLQRPSLPLVVASLALFVALGGPAEAQRLISGKDLRKGSVTSRAVKDRALQMRDLSRRAQRRLRATRNNSITENKLANGAVTPGKLALGAIGTSAVADHSLLAVDFAAGSVGAATVADGSLGGAKVADGSLSAADVARFQGLFSMDIGPVLPDKCWSRVPVLAELQGSDISQDLVLVTPGADWPELALTFMVRNDGDRDRFVIAACNQTNEPVTVPDVGFRYMVIDLLP
jgi:hypothetical protein